MEDQQLVDSTKYVDDHLVKAIHKYYAIFKRLSDKQREVLYCYYLEEERQEFILDTALDKMYKGE